MGKRIKVSGFQAPTQPRGRRDAVRKVPLVRVTNLPGIIGAVGIIGASLFWGTPHLLLFTSSSGYGSLRYYDDCAYVGFDRRIVHLRGVSCPFFRLLKREH